MSEIQVASRYAKSLIDLAEEQHALELIKKDMELFTATCKENSTLQAVLKNPIISPGKKTGILTALFGDKLHPVILAFFKIMVAKGRSGVLYVTAKEFINEYNIRKNVVKATLTSAIPLTEDNRKLIKETVKQAIKGEVILMEKIDPSLIGGFVLNVGDKQFDASIANHLHKLKKEFEKTAIV